MTDLTHTLDEIKRVTEAATEGPWHWGEYGDLLGPVDPDFDAPVFAMSICNGLISTYDGTAEFIALARTALPELVAEVERLREDLEAARFAMDHNVARIEDIKETVDLCRDRLDDFTLDELSSTLDDHPCPAEGFQYVSRRAEAAEATIERVRKVAEQVEADDRESLNRHGQHLAGSVVIVAEMIRDALKGQS